MQQLTYSLTMILVMAAATCQAAEWGDLTATFVYDGPAPVPVKAKVEKDVAFCGKFNLVDESLVVNSENGGIANLLCHLYIARGGKSPEVHEDYAKTAEAEVRLDNKNCRFEPRMTILRTSQKLVVGNPDQVGHNTNITSLANPAQNILVPAGGELQLDFKLKERFPVQVACNIHPWMQARLVVKDHPYVAVSDVDGKLTIKNLPVGTWTFQFWHERAGYVSKVTVGGKQTEWSRGRVELEIKPGQNDLGVIKLAPSVFEER